MITRCIFNILLEYFSIKIRIYQHLYEIKKKNDGFNF